MKTSTLIMGMLFAAACSKKSPPATPTADPKKPAPAASKNETPVEALGGDQKVSPGLAVAPDLAAACGIKPAESTTPTFDYDKDDLTADDRKVLDQIAACLTTGALKGKGVSLIGRADPRGTEEYNLGLGSRRAETVSAYLARSGVTSPQLATSTRGAIDASGTDEASWAQDRRVDITMRNDAESKEN